MFLLTKPLQVGVVGVQLELLTKDEVAELLQRPDDSEALAPFGRVETLGRRLGAAREADGKEAGLAVRVRLELTQPCTNADVRGIALEHKAAGVGAVLCVAHDLRGNHRRSDRLEGGLLRRAPLELTARTLHVDRAQRRGQVGVVIDVLAEVRRKAKEGPELGAGGGRWAAGNPARRPPW